MKAKDQLDKVWERWESLSRELENHLTMDELFNAETEDDEVPWHELIRRTDKAKFEDLFNDLHEAIVEWANYNDPSEDYPPGVPR